MEENLKGADLCEICGNDVEDKGIECTNCKRWFHFSCVILKKIPAEDKNWFCSLCKKTQPSLKNVFDKDPVLLAEKLESWASSIPTSAFYCELCHKQFETDEEMILHNKLGHEEAVVNVRKKIRKKSVEKLAKIVVREKRERSKKKT